MSEKEEADLSEHFRALREESQERRAANRANAPNVLREAGIDFTEHNNGAHLIVHYERFDFWPGTGKWKDRRSSGHGRGLMKLVARIKQLRGGLRT